MKKANITGNKITEVELVREGTFNGTRVSSKQIDAWLSDFERNSRDGYYPTIHIGHTTDNDDTKPAEGLITRMYRKGKAIFADIEGIGETFLERIRHYPYRSIEGSGDRLRSVALLGATPPAVKTSPIFFSEKTDNFIINLSQMDEVKKLEESPQEEVVEVDETTNLEEEVESTETEEVKTEAETTEEVVEVEEEASEEPSKEIELSEKIITFAEFKELEDKNVKLAEELNSLKREKIEREVSEKVASFVFSETNTSGFVKSGDEVKDFALTLDEEKRVKFFELLENLETVEKFSEPKGFSDSSAESETMDKVSLRFAEIARLKAEKGIDTTKADLILRKEQPNLYN